MNVIDNFLEEEEFKKIRKTFLSIRFPWFISEIIDDKSFKENKILNIQLCNLLFKNKKIRNDLAFDLVKPILKKINCTELYRVKANMNFGDLDPVLSSFHVDTSSPGLTGIYYINTCNGYTLFEEGGIKVDSVENRMLIFDNKLRHTGVTCSDNKLRVVINFNWR